MYLVINLRIFLGIFGLEFVFLEYKNKLVFELDLELEFEEELEELELEEFEFEFELVDVLFFLCFLEFECVLIEILLDLFLLF